MTRAYLEVSSMYEDVWTGIANVVAAIAARGLTDPHIDWSFCYETVEIPESEIRTMLDQRSGAGGLAKLADKAWHGGRVTSELAANAVGVFPNMKPMRRFFGREAVMIHDLSALITPQFHNADTIHHVANHMRADVETSDHIFCVSEATRTDVETYLEVPREKTSVVRLGAALDPADVSCGLLSIWDKTPQPYVAIVGTLEPRKNGGIVFDYLRQNPGFASQYQIVFIGRDGWLDEKGRLMRELEASGVNPDRVLFTGFVSEAEKVALMMNSAFCVYPSFFEGFGLPILEAAALGKITVCSNSSSMTEVHPENSVFFNPLDVFEFGQAMRIAELRAAQTRSRTQSLHDIMSRADRFSWDACYATIAAWIKEQ